MDRNLKKNENTKWFESNKRFDFRQKGYKISKLILIGVIFIIFQSYLQNSLSVGQVFKRYMDCFTPVIYGIFIALFLEPIVTKLETRWKLKRGIAITITIFGIIGIIALFVGVIFPKIIESIKEIYDRVPEIQVKLEQYITDVIGFLKNKKILIIGEGEIKENINNFIKGNFKHIQAFTVSAIVNTVWWIGKLTEFFIGSFLGILILLGKEYFVSFVKNILDIVSPQNKKDEILDFLVKSRTLMLNYVWGRLVVSVAVGVIAFIVMFITGTPHALLTGVMIGAGNMIPYVGSLIAGAIAIFLVGMAAPAKLIFLGLAICIAQIVDGWVIGPKVVSDTVGMQTFWIVTSVIIAGKIWGTVGMFFGVPIFGMIKLIYIKLLAKNKRRSDRYVR